MARTNAGPEESWVHERNANARPPPPLPRRGGVCRRADGRTAWSFFMPRLFSQTSGDRAHRRPRHHAPPSPVACAIAVAATPYPLPPNPFCSVSQSHLVAGRQGGLRRRVESLQLARREQEARDADVRAYYGDHAALGDAHRAAERDPDRRRAAAVAGRRAEQAALEDLERSLAMRDLAHRQREDEERILAEVGARERRRERERLELMRLRSESDELVDLRAKLEAAKMNAQRRAQLDERNEVREREAAYEAALVADADDRRRAADAEEKRREQSRRDAYAKAKEVLSLQMDERREAQRLAQEAFELDRAQVDAAARKIQEEDAALAAARRNKKAETRAYIEAFTREQEEARQRAIEEEEAEDARIEAQAEALRQRDAEVQAAKIRKREKADEIYTKIKAQQEAAAKEREEEERLIALLRAEEGEERERQKAEERREKLERDKREMWEANELQQRLRAERRAVEEAEEAEFRRRAQAKFEEDERVDRANAARRRQMALDHRAEVERIIAERRDMYERMRALEAEEVLAQRAAEEGRKARIDAERRALLEEFAHLAEFFPRGVAKNADELSFFQRR